MHSVARTRAGHPRPCLKLPDLWPRRPRTSSRTVSLSSQRQYATATTQLDLPALGEKWRLRWQKRDHFEEQRARRQTVAPENEQPKSTGRHMYILPMFPYPSGNLHLGHLRVYTIADVIARFRRLQGRQVLLPMGWDAFGLPAENAAIERGIDPADWTRDNIARMKEQLKMMNASFDWSREFATCDPDYYKQTQRIFLLLREHGLVSQKEATVNWDPVDNTVLANEQVDSDGRSWRSGAKIEKRNLKQWFFHITDFKESLLRDLEKLGEDDAWPERVLAMQKNWLGRTDGAYFRFPLHTDIEMPGLKRPKLYTSRPETIFAAQFVALSPQSPVVKQIAEYDPELRDFLERTKHLSHDNTEGYRIPNISARNPVGYLNEFDGKRFENIPVYVAPYVRGDYETGAVMGVPAHDARDHAFWKRHHPGEAVKYAVTPHPNGDDPPLQGRPFLETGYMTTLAADWATMSSTDTAKDVVLRLKRGPNMAKATSKWKIRDWLISRQRYWGTPIPIIHCKECGPQPVPDDQLPVRLPQLKKKLHQDRPTGNPLESLNWVQTPCPKCHGPADRDTDTMDTFVDSSWYYMRFAEPHNSDLPVSEAAAKSRLPVDMYVGGVEHAILHLLYARFVYKAVMGILYPVKTAHTKEDTTTVLLKLRKQLRSEYTPETRKHEIEAEMDMLQKSGLPDLIEAPTDSSHEPFKRLITQGMVHGKTYTDPVSGRILKPEEVDLSDPSKPKVAGSGQAATVTFEKMSKSKHNGVDPTTFIAKYGADATRAHILFQAPVGEVLNWDEDKIAGVTRWIRRVYEHVQNLAAAGIVLPKTERGDMDARKYFSRSATALDTMNKEETAEWNADVEVWRTTQNAIVSVTNAFRKVYSLNTAVSTLMGLTNTLLDHPAASDLIKRKAITRLLQMMAPITPAFAEECWSILHSSNKSIFDQDRWGWPVPDGSLRFLTPSQVKCAVQINGKLRCVVEIPPKPMELVQNWEVEKWLTAEILKVPEAQAKLATSELDIRKAKRVFPVRGCSLVNYLMPNETKET